MSLYDNLNNPAFLELLEEKLDSIINPSEKRSNSAYTEVFSAVRSWLGDMPSTIPDMCYAEGDTVLERALRGERMYSWLVNYVMAMLKPLEDHARKLSGEAQIQYYLREWAVFQDVSKLLKNLFMELESRWMSNESKYIRGCNSVQDTLQQLWFQFFFSRISVQLVESAIVLVDQRRNYGVLDDNVIAQLPKALVDLKPEDTPEILVPFRSNLGAYIRYYERPYIESAIRFVEGCAPPQLAKSNTGDYIRRLQNSLAEEDARNRLYMHKNSLTPMKHAINHGFLLDHADAISDEAKKMLAHSKFGESSEVSDGLLCVYSLLQRLDGSAVRRLLDIFAEHVQNDFLKRSPLVGNISLDNDPIVGRASIRDGSNAGKLALKAVNYLTEARNLYIKTINKCFDGNSDFIQALNDAFTRTVNSSKLEENLSADIKHLVALYCHYLLVRNSQLIKTLVSPADEVEPAIEAEMQKALGILSVCEKRESLCQYYKKYLAHRLVGDMSQSLDMEKTALNMIFDTIARTSAGMLVPASKQGRPQMVSQEFLLKYQTGVMLSDISISQDLTQECAQHPARDSASSDRVRSKTAFEFKVLCKREWDSMIQSNRSQGFGATTGLVAMQDRLETIYRERHESRNLNWQWNYTKATVQFYFPETKGRYAKTGYTLILNAYQVAILELFAVSEAPEGAVSGQHATEAHETLTPKRICALTGMERRHVDMELARFKKACILQQASSKNDAGDIAVQLNRGFNSKSSRIDISYVEDVKTVLDERQSKPQGPHCIGYLKADIVHILKGSDPMLYGDILKRVATKRAKFFTVTTDLFKEAVDNLLSEMYIDRVDGSYDYLVYVPIN
ncbi:ubiquitin ligase (cullin) of SCF [Coemansia sp. RSA 988]|nr:ubiquitin ligase (cullin) of SCF [Coemansia sp. RSA 988]